MPNYVNNNGVPSHNHNHPSHDNWDPHDDGRGHQRKKKPQLHHTVRRQGSHHRDPNPDMQYCSSGDGLSFSEDESIADAGTKAKEP